MVNGPSLHARWAVAPSEATLTCYLHVVMYDVYKTSSKCHVNRMVFIRLPVSSVWCHGYDTVMMHRRIQGDIRYMSEQFCVDGKIPAAQESKQLHANMELQSLAAAGSEQTLHEK